MKRWIEITKPFTYWAYGNHTLKVGDRFHLHINEVVTSGPLVDSAKLPVGHGITQTITKDHFKFVEKTTTETWSDA